MKNLLIGVHIAGTNVPKVIENIVAAEHAGVQCAWMTCGGTAPDPLAIQDDHGIRTVDLPGQHRFDRCSDHLVLGLEHQPAISELRGAPGAHQERHVRSALLRRRTRRAWSSSRTTRSDDRSRRCGACCAW